MPIARIWSASYPASCLKRANGICSTAASNFSLASSSRNSSEQIGIRGRKKLLDSETESILAAEE